VHGLRILVVSMTAEVQRYVEWAKATAWDAVAG
jgi:hypothetical protein